MKYRVKSVGGRWPIVRELYQDGFANRFNHYLTAGHYEVIETNDEEAIVYINLKFYPDDLEKLS